MLHQLTVLSSMQVRYWDLRQPNPAHTQQMPERVYGMDVSHPLLVRRFRV